MSPVSVTAGNVGAKAAELAGTGVRAILANKMVAIVLAIILVVALGGVFDTVSNMGKAYGNVTINGVDVGGLDAQAIEEKLASTIGMNAQHTQVKIYATERAKQIETENLDEDGRDVRAEQIAQAEQISFEQAYGSMSYWTTDALSLKGVVPYEELANAAIAVGRDDGGILARFGLFFGGRDIPVQMTFDKGLLDGLASEVDRAIGDPRIDNSVEIVDGVASAAPGHEGLMVDRDWFAETLSNAFISDESNPWFTAELSAAPSRTTMEQAQAMSDCVNRALKTGGVFAYNGKDWEALGYDIGQWTRVETVEKDGAYELSAHIDEAAAIPAVMAGAGAAVKSDNVTVKFLITDQGVIVRTFGPGNVPEVTPAIEELNEALYGENGVAWQASALPQPVRIEIVESDAPAALKLDQAIELGIVTVIGEYTTEFSNYEGTENRNHNIKLAADLLNNSIVDAKGGTWSFNDRAGDTNEAAGFWSAGSIVEGEYVDSIGGGICQVATTVFNAVYEAGLPVNTRFNHTLYIASYPTGRDAAVSYPDLDLKWTNDLASDVLLQMSYTDTTITAKLYSVRTGYSVESIEGEWQEGAKYSTKFEVDPDLGKDAYFTKTSGEDGSVIDVTRIVKNEAGQVVSDQTFESRYDAKDEVIVVGEGTDTSRLARSDQDSQGSRPSRDQEEHEDRSGHEPDSGGGEDYGDEGDYYDYEYSEEE